MSEGGGDSDDRLFLHLAAAYRRSGQLTRAEGLLLRSLEEREDAGAWSTLAEVQTELGKEEAARGSWKRVLQLDPTNTAALAALIPLERGAGRAGKAETYARRLARLREGEPESDGARPAAGAEDRAAGGTGASDRERAARRHPLARWITAEETRLRATEAAGGAAPAPPVPPAPAPPDIPSPAEATGPASPPAEELPPSKYTVPRIGPGRERLIRVLALLILGYWTYYIAWRWTSTLNWEALWFSIPLVLAETWGLLAGYLLVFTTWKLRHRTPLPAPPDLAVDVFITTYDEPLEVIRRTAISAREIRYPHRTFVLDDGRRDEVRAMAEELEIGYLRRDDNRHAKAGNLNHALQHTRGDFILQLDADHAPLPHILDRLLGFFADRRVAFVQAPQDFYNIDSFTTEVDEEARRIWEEQKLFFSVIQPGKDSWNSAFFCGSCAVLRRSALEEIGGFSTESVTEDIETSLLLHARGWKSVYYGESLAYGLAAGSAEAFHTQHSRWAQGAMQVLRRFNPLTYPGLTLAQRLGYFYSLTAYVAGLQKLVFYAAPIVFFLTGVLPIQALDREFLVRFVPYLLLAVALVEMLSRGLGFTWITERYQMAKFWTYARALPVYLSLRRLPFRVTPKGPGHVPLKTYLPQLSLMVLTVVAVNWATLAHRLGWVEYGVPGWASLAFQLNFLWAGINFVLAAYVVRLSVRLQQHRQDHRFSDRFPIQLQPRGSRGRLGERRIALTMDLNASGLSFRSVERFEPGTELKLTLPLSTGEVAVRGEVVHAHPDPGADLAVQIHGVEFKDVPLDVRDAIELHCAHHAVPIEQMRYRNPAGVFTRAQQWVRNARGEPRRRIRLAARVRLGRAPTAEGGAAGTALLEEISRGGARLIMDQPVPPGTRVAFEVPGTELAGEGEAVFSRALETPIGVRFAVGLRRESTPEHPRPRRKMLIPRLWRAARAAAALALALGALPAGVAAQVQSAVYGGAELDTEGQELFLLGGSVAWGGLGWQPVASLLGYWLSFPIGTGDATLQALNPAAGVRYQWPVGAVQATAGYLLLLGDEDQVVSGVPVGGEEGLTTTLLADYWGTGAWTAQGITSFNWADDYLWTRARLARQVADLGGRALLLGGELVYQGADLFAADETADPRFEEFEALQLAPLLEYRISPDLRLLGAAGVKTDNLEANPEWYPYFRAEFVYLP